LKGDAGEPRLAVDVDHLDGLRSRQILVVSVRVVVVVDADHVTHDRPVAPAFEAYLEILVLAVLPHGNGGVVVELEPHLEEQHFRL